MKRLRTLGLATAMALALTASIGAASSTAAQFEAAEYPVTIESSGGEGMFYSGESWSCSAPAFAATLYEPTETLTTEYIQGGPCPSAKMSMNGCQITFKAEKEGDGTLSFGPANCGPIGYKHSTTGCPASFDPHNNFHTYASHGNTESGIYIGMTAMLKWALTGSGWCQTNLIDGAWLTSWEVTSSEGTEIWISE